VSFGKEKVPLNELQKNLLAGAKAVLLKDDSLGILHDDWLQQYSSIIKHGKVNKNEIAVARWMAITEQQFDPYGAPPRPKARTTEDYLREREEQERAGKNET